MIAGKQDVVSNGGNKTMESNIYGTTVLIEEEPKKLGLIYHHLELVNGGKAEDAEPSLLFISNPKNVDNLMGFCLEDAHMDTLLAWTISEMERRMPGHLRKKLDNIAGENLITEILETLGGKA